MQLRAQHTILRHHLDLTFRGKRDEKVALSEMETLMKTTLMSSLEKLFDEFCPEDAVIQVDKIHLDLGTLNLVNFQTSFPEIYIQRLRQYLEHQVSVDYIRNLTTQANFTPGKDPTLFKRQPLKYRFQQDYLYFLTTGHWPSQLPYILPAAEHDQLLLDCLRDTPGFAGHVMDLVQRGGVEATRFAMQATPAVMEELWVHFERTLPASAAQIWKLLVSWLEKFPGSSTLRKEMDIAHTLLHYCPPGMVVEFFKKPAILDSPAALATWLRRVSAYMGWDLPGLAALIRAHANEDSQSSVISGAFWTGLSEALYEGLASEKQAPYVVQSKKKEGESTVAATSAKLEATDIPIHLDENPGLPELNDSGLHQDFIAVEALASDLQQKQIMYDPGSIEDPQTDTHEKDTAEPATWYVNSAGLVILHPFLPAFFRELSLFDGLIKKDEEALARSMHLLHYLAEGKEQPLEGALLLPKLLSGIPLGKPVPRFIILSETEKAEANALLKSVVRNWAALKNTSTEALQETFLKRSGKLSYQDDWWRLVVETKAVDILLERMPWQVSTFKLPWMKHLLFVDWY